MKKIAFLIFMFLNLWADCSDNIGGMTLNEAYKDTSLTGSLLGHKPFVELKYLDDSLKDEDLSDWQIIITKNNGDEVEYNLSSSCDSDSDYISIELDNSDEIDTKNGTTIVVKDNNGNYVDWLKIGNGSDADDEASKCDYDYDTDSDGSSDNEVDVYRDPDGTGDWITKSQSGFFNLTDDSSSCDDNDDGSSTVVVDDNDNADNDCEDSDYKTIKDALDAIRDGDSDATTIKVCPNENNKSAYSDVLEINNSDKFKNLVIKRGNTTKPYYIENKDNTPIIIDGVDGVTIKGAVIETDEDGIELKNNLSGLIISDINISSGKCGVKKIHTDGTFMNKLKMYGGIIDSDNESAFCLMDINNSGCNKFFNFTLKAPKFGFDMWDNVSGCGAIINGNIEADSGSVCTDLNMSIVKSADKKNIFKSKNMGIAVSGGIFDFKGIDISINVSSSTGTGVGSSSTESCKGDSKYDGYGIYIDKVTKDFNYSLNNVNMNSNQNGVYIEGNDNSKFQISDSKFYAKNTAFEINHTTADWNISNVEFNSSDEYALKITGGDRPFISNVSAVSKKGIYFTDVKNLQITGKESLKKVVTKDGDGLYFAGDSANFNIQKLMITSPNGSGIVFEGTGDKFNLKNNYFVGCKTGVYFKGTGNLASSDANFTNNFFMNSGDEGVKIDNQDNSFDLTIKDNTFFENTAVYNDEDDIKVDNNYWGSFPFGNGKSDKDEKGETNGTQKIDDNTLTTSPVKFEVIDYQFDECDDSDPSDLIKPDAGVSAKRHNTTRDDWEVINSSLEFNGTDSSYVDVENVDLSDEVSFIAWVKLTDSNDGDIIADTDNKLSITDKKITFSLNLDGDINTLQTDSLDLNKWYQIIACYDGENMEIYTNGEKNVSQSASGFIVNYDSNLSIGKNLKAIIDEPKILKVSVCGTAKNIYKYENNREEYYNKRDRERSSCALVHNKFDAVDKGKSEKISTKKIGDDFDLTIKANQDFSGKVWSVVQRGDENISDVNESLWNSEQEKNITIKNIEKITKKAHIYIKWDDNSSGNDDGDTNSSDDFAIIPIKYIFDVPSEIKAGENYNIEINSTDDNGKVREYNQTLDGSSDKNSTLVFVHKNGDKEDNGTITLDFSDGVAKRDDFNITDIGEYILELNDTNYANIDKEDTAEKDRTIYGTVKIKVIPYKFKINLKTHKTSTGKKWLYQGKEFNYTIEANITALNKNNKVLKHFDKDEYSTDVNSTLKFNLLKTDEKDVNLSYVKKENNNYSDEEIEIKNGSYEVNYTIKDSNFTKGESSFFGISSYIEKEIDNPKSPIDMNITEVNTTSKSAENNGVNMEDNVSYYYPKLDTEDIFTTYKETNSTIQVLVYDKNDSDAKQRLKEKNMILIDWYRNVDDNNIRIDSFIMKKSSKMDSDSIDINLTLNNSLKGERNITVDNNTTPKTTYGIIHLDTPLYLWHSKYNKTYSYQNDSNCINHYCIEYNYQSDKEQTTRDVGSGTFDGSEVNNSLKTSTDRKGVKIFR